MKTNRLNSRYFAIGLILAALLPTAQAKSLYINFGITLDDANAIDSNESSVVGLTGAETVPGTGWNNVLLGSASGTPTSFTAATQSGNHINLINSTGTDSGVDLSSNGSFFSNFGNVSTPNQTSTGDAGLLQSYLLLNNTESVSLSGLASWAPNGYRVRALFDIGPVTRNYGITMHDGGTPRTFWTADTATTDTDANNDGVIEWKETTATTESTAVANANHAIFGPFSGDTLIISGAGTASRAALSGLQIIANTDPPATLGPIDVYLLGGQSNMQGTAKTADLPSKLLSIPEIKLYAAGTGVSGTIANQWVTLRPANGSTFGPEIGIGEKMRDLCPGQPIALIKYAASGNSLEIDFKPGANAADTANWGASFTGMVNTYNNGLAALVAQGWTPVIKGMCWQQGEQDAKDGLNVAESTTSADDYGANLAHFVSRIRAQFAAKASPNGIRFVPGQVLPYAPPGGDVVTRFPGRDLVRQAILNAAENSGAPLSISNTRPIPTNSITHPVHEQEVVGNTDEVHLGATAQLNLGRSMAYAMFNLDPQTYLQWANSRSVVGGPDDDDDHDGLTNRTEYMLGGNPTDAGNAPRPLLSFIGTGGGATPTYTVSRNLTASDLAPKIQFSADLADWTTNPPVFISSVKQSDGTAILSYQGPWTVTGHARGFFRTIETAP